MDQYRQASRHRQSVGVWAGGCSKIAVRGAAYPRTGGGQVGDGSLDVALWSRVWPARGPLAAATYRGPQGEAGNGFLKQPCAGPQSACGSSFWS